MGLFIGNSAPNKVYIGNTEVSGIYVGTTNVRPTEQSYEPGQFCELGNDILNFDYTKHGESSIIESGTVYPVDDGQAENYNNIFLQYCSDGDADLPSGGTLVEFIGEVCDVIFNQLGEDSSYSQVEIAGISSSGGFNLPEPSILTTTSIVLNTQYNFSNLNNDVKYYLLGIVLSSGDSFALNDIIKLYYNDDNKKLSSDDNIHLSGTANVYLMLITLSQP